MTLKNLPRHLFQSGFWFVMHRATWKEKNVTPHNKSKITFMYCWLSEGFFLVKLLNVSTPNVLKLRLYSQSDAFIRPFKPLGRLFDFGPVTSINQIFMEKNLRKKKDLNTDGAKNWERRKIFTRMAHKIEKEERS